MFPTCYCFVREEVCEGLQSLHACELPAPCPTLTEDSGTDVASCVLGLLVEQQPARFYYNFWDISGQRWSGWFYVLGPGDGVDGECYYSNIGPVTTEDERVAHATIEAPAYFADCLDATADVMRSCIFNGISTLGELDECEGG